MNAAEIIIRAVKHGIRFRMQRIIRGGEHLEVTVCDGDLECSRRMSIDDSPEYNDIVLANIIQDAIDHLYLENSRREEHP